MRAQQTSAERRAAAKLKVKAKPNGKAHDAKPERPRMQISDAQIANARSLPKRGDRQRDPFLNPFKPAVMPPGVFPTGKKQKLAMDEFPGVQWGASLVAEQSAMLSAYDQSVSFMGYPALSLLAQLPEYRNLSETIATEMTRKWIRFHTRGDAKKEAEKLDNVRGAAGKAEAKQADVPAEDRAPIGEDPDVMAALLEYAEQREQTDNGDPEQTGEPGEPGVPGEETNASEDNDDRIQELEDAFDRLGVRDLFAQIALNDGFFGRAHLFLDFGVVDFKDPKEKEELVSDIGTGRGDLSKAKCNELQPLHRLVAVEPTWAYPANYNADNPLTENWYNPETWYVQQNEIHRSRFLTFVSRPVPDMLKPAFAFGGLSLTQMAKPTVDNWLRTRRGVGEIINSFSIFTLFTNLNQELQSGGNEFLTRRAMLFNSTRDNQGLMIIDKDLEDFQNVAAPLSTLDVLQAQSQEHMASVSRIPIVKLLGVQPAGLNADSEGIIRTFYDTINAMQHRFFRPNLQTVFWFIQLSLWGEVDEDITFSFEPLWELDELQKSTKRKADADTDNILIQAGVIDPSESRQRVADDPDMPYQNLDPDEVPEPPEPEMPPGMSPGFGGAPGGGPPTPPGAAVPGAKPKPPAASNAKPPAKGE